jgi:predicted dienelactone hydrolase
MHRPLRLIASGLILLIPALAAWSANTPGATANPTPPSNPGVDAPELAKLGNHAVGVRTLELVDRNQYHVVAVDPKTGSVPKQDRKLTVDLWYPAVAAKNAQSTIYSAQLDSEPPRPPAAFTVPGIAVRNAQMAAGRFPLVIVAHGYGNVTAGMTWLTENLASKGYVVAAIRHEDYYFNPLGFPHALLRRPLDISFVAREFRQSLAAAGHVDPERIALIGYSMGGYGVLTAGGATLEPPAPLAAQFPGGVIRDYVRGGPARDQMRAPAVKAVVAIAPAGGQFGAWGATGLADLTAPLFLIAGDRDRTVDYKSGARAFFDAASNSNRYLLTFREGGHALGLGPVPAQMRGQLWDQDWFEDPVWRKDRIIGISLHMITAFLDRYVKDDASRSAYLDGLVEDSSQGVWTPDPKSPWAAYSQGSGGVTVWKGFQRRHAEGLTLLHSTAGTAPAR